MTAARDDRYVIAIELVYMTRAYIFQFYVANEIFWWRDIDILCHHIAYINRSDI